MSAVTHPRFAPRRGGAKASSWWGRAWVRAVEEAAYADRDLKHGRRLARDGAVGGIAVDSGTAFAAVVEGDDAWTTSVRVPTLDAAGISALVEVVAAESGRIAALVAGELPHTLVEHAEEAGVELLPYGSELDAQCNCDHWVAPCPHAVAVLSQIAWLVDADPFVLLTLRGLSREELLARLHKDVAAAAEVDPELEADLDTAEEAVRRVREELARAE
ncbi:SWIM zinc finger family protein [Nocardioides alcanivorans]|uniref:SWIM zinc finger family protein n=1 Tax=Nocardioides alcanivorans TaxID=2897352 RepID=UPI001F2C6495|nr:hypothetical protein [Nocardioides alcanivorans]